MLFEAGHEDFIEYWYTLGCDLGQPIPDAVFTASRYMYMYMSFIMYLHGNVHTLIRAEVKKNVKLAKILRMIFTLLENLNLTVGITLYFYCLEEASLTTRGPRGGLKITWMLRVRYTSSDKLDLCKYVTFVCKCQYFWDL